MNDDWLTVNIKPMFRIKKRPRGWVVEYLLVKRFMFWTYAYWYHYIPVSGIDSLPWHFYSFEQALKDLTEKIKRETVDNSQHPL